LDTVTVKYTAAAPPVCVCNDKPKHVCHAFENRVFLVVLMLLECWCTRPIFVFGAFLFLARVAV
jgi:hypothetical protein